MVAAQMDGEGRREGGRGTIYASVVIKNIFGFSVHCGAPAFPSATGPAAAAQTHSYY